MFDVLVYLYETYYRPEACPESDVLVKKLAAIGFEDEEISEALGWLTDLAETNNDFLVQFSAPSAFSDGTRIYAKQELDVLGTEAVGFIEFLDSAKIITPIQREIIVERALAVGEPQVSLDKFKIIVLMVLWSQGKEPDGLIFDELFSDDEDAEPRLLH